MTKFKCSMNKKKESLFKAFEATDSNEVTFSVDGVNVMVTKVDTGEYVQEYTLNDVRGTYNNLLDVIKLVADKAIYDDDFRKPQNWNILDIDEGTLTLAAATTQDGDGDNDPNGDYIADYTVMVDCEIKKPASNDEIEKALSIAKINH